MALTTTVVHCHFYLLALQVDWPCTRHGGVRAGVSLHPVLESLLPRSRLPSCAQPRGWLSSLSLGSPSMPYSQHLGHPVRQRHSIRCYDLTLANPNLMQIAMPTVT